ncbi:MAG: thioredoxin domain-containing protein, partial [Elusimicrobia bacterium]|nr:thioredoxin domain-containing protein [Elusimicrobiota bacterium]
VRVALQAFPQSQSQAEAQRDLPTYLSQSCILESSTTVKSPISVGLGHLPLKGDPRAKLNIVEFADFQCSFCKRFFTDIEPKIIKDYVSTGKANFYFRHLPFLGTESTSAAEAAECANEQKKFWAFHDYLFSHQANENSGTFSIKNLEGFAAGMGLDAAKFKTCLETGKYAKQIAGDSADGKKAGLNGAPATFINGANGSLIFGSPAYSDFQKAIEAALKQ